MERYHIWTIGCQMNKADSERLGGLLEGLGYRQTPLLEEADIIILNSCTVRQGAENRVSSKLGSLKHLKRRPHSPTIALTGCMVRGQGAELRKRFPQVDLFFAPQAFHSLVRALGSPEMPEPYPAPRVDHQVSVYVPVIQGCNKFCTYCIVPYRRGRERSRPLDEIRCEVERLVEHGVREVTLLGQNVDSYGHDLPGSPDLTDLLYELHTIPGLVRLRFLTSHPKDITPKLIEAVARLEKVCKHFNLPVQAGDDEILAAMRRGYTVAEYRDLIHRIRQAIPHVSLSTDIIVGFPGENEEQFQGTLDLLCELRFDTVHVAAYSPRPGTFASRLPDDVAREVKRERLQRVEALQREISLQINAQLLGERVEVLVEGPYKGKWQGRTRSNKLVFFSDPTDQRGRLVQILVEKASPWSLQGRLVA